MIRIYGSFSAKDDKHCHYIFTNDVALLKRYPVCETELW